MTRKLNMNEIINGLREKVKTHEVMSCISYYFLGKADGCKEVVDVLESVLGDVDTGIIVDGNVIKAKDGYTGTCGHCLKKNVSNISLTFFSFICDEKCEEERIKEYKEYNDAHLKVNNENAGGEIYDQNLP